MENNTKLKLTNDAPLLLVQLHLNKYEHWATTVVDVYKYNYILNKFERDLLMTMFEPPPV